MNEADYELQQYLRNSPDVAKLNEDMDDTGKKKKPKKKRRKMQSKLEARMADQMDLLDIPEPEVELRFHDTRRWRFDFAWPDMMLALEVNGGTWIKGRHNRGSSVGKDYEKLNEAQILGWSVLQFTTDQVKDGTAIDTLMRAIEAKNGTDAKDKH